MKIKERWASLLIIIVALIVCIIMLLGKGYEILSTRGLITKEPANATGIEVQEVDWASIYPFKERNEVKSDAKTEISSEGVKSSRRIEKYQKLWQKIDDLGSENEEHIPYYNLFLEIGGKVKRVLEADTQLNSPTYGLLNNGYLYYKDPRYGKKRYENMISKYNSLQTYLSEKNIPLLYIQTPRTICEYDTQLPEGVSDNMNENINFILQVLNENEIDVLDLRNELHEDGLNHYDFFFKTDHHWNIDASLWAATEIANTISEKYNIVLDTELLEKDKYETKICEKAMFGSAGQSVTRAWAEPEDFYIYLPKFETSFRVRNLDLNQDMSGSFDETMIKWDFVNECVEAGGGYVYSSYMYGNRPLTQITNNMNPEGPSVLMIRDSFSLGVAPYLALATSELDLIDVRDTHGNFTGSIKTYIEEMNPDIVLILYNDMANESLE